MILRENSHAASMQRAPSAPLFVGIWDDGRMSSGELRNRSGGMRIAPKSVRLDVWVLPCLATASFAWQIVSTPAKAALRLIRNPDRLRRDPRLRVADAH